MAISEKAKEKFDEASKEIRDAIDSLKDEVKDLTSKVKEKLKGSGEEMRESAEELTREVKRLSEKVKDLIPKRRKKGQVPFRVDKFQGLTPGAWERPFLDLRRSMGWPHMERKSPWGLTTDFIGADWPLVDMSETDDEIRIIAELPGVDKDDLDISVTDDRITIRGEKKEEEEERGRGYYRLERSYGSFQRSFPLPCEVESDRADASFKDGILTLKLPKSAAARKRIKKIPIKTS